jgi:hypothetical protein
MQIKYIKILFTISILYYITSSLQSQPFQNGFKNIKSYQIDNFLNQIKSQQIYLADLPIYSIFYVDSSYLNNIIAIENEKLLTKSGNNSQIEANTNEASPIVRRETKSSKQQYSADYAKNLIRFSPVHTIAGALYGFFQFRATYVRYVHPKIGIPVQVEYAYDGFNSIGIYSGIEAVPVTHREKSGLYLNLLAGPVIVLNAGVGLGIYSHIGYQLFTKKGFALTTAIGVQTGLVNNGSGLSGVIAPSFMLDIGFGW